MKPTNRITFEYKISSMDTDLIFLAFLICYFWTLRGGLRFGSVPPVQTGNRKWTMQLLKIAENSLLLADTRHTPSFLKWWCVPHIIFEKSQIFIDHPGLQCSSFSWLIIQKKNCCCPENNIFVDLPLVRKGTKTMRPWVGPTGSQKRVKSEFYIKWDL